MALTFDEGPSGATKQILQVLKEKGVTATFFLSGDAAEASPATAKAIVDAGCEIGSNSYSDDSLKGRDREAVREQITKGTDAIKSATGVKTMLLRAPYAAFDEQNWIDAMDWSPPWSRGILTRATGCSTVPTSRSRRCSIR